MSLGKYADSSERHRPVSEGQRGPQQPGEGLTQTEGVAMERSRRGQMEEILQEGNPQELATVWKWKAKEREERGGSLGKFQLFSQYRSSKSHTSNHRTP